MAKGKGFKYQDWTFVSGFIRNAPHILQLYAAKHQRGYRQKYGSTFARGSSNDLYGRLEYAQTTILFSGSFTS